MSSPRPMSTPRRAGSLLARLAGASLAVLVGCAGGDVPLQPQDDSEWIYDVPRGATAYGIGADLEAEGLSPGGWQYKLYLRQSGKGGCIKAGRFALRRNMSLDEVMDTLCGPPLPEDEPFTVVEGWRIRDIDAALVAKGWIEAGDYIALAESKSVDLPFEIESPTLEGYLFPETYLVVPDSFDVETFIERQLAMFHDRFLASHSEDIGPRGLHAVVVMASMLEREEPKPTQRPIVAGILWKRIDHNWKLGVDATSRYTLDEWNDRSAFLTNLRDPADPYNTRLHHGLPPTAIGNPSLLSLEAALEPVPSEFWFYLHDGEGTFHGGVDAAHHERNRRTYNVY